MVKGKLRRKSLGRFGRVMNLTLTFLLIASITYGFLSLCYWSLDLTAWGGFGRFILAAEGVIWLIKIADEW
jgi:hypothetical protein